MDAVQLEKELWKINNELVKAGIFPREYPSMADAVAELVKRYKAAQQSGQGTVCECSHEDFYVVAETGLCENCGLPRR